MSRRRDERGAATTVVIAMAGLLLFVGVALAGVAGLVVEHRRAQSAADLAALAGASALAHGNDGCAAAGSVASRNGAALTACTIDGADVRVRVSVGERATAEARAGPAGQE